MAVEMKYLVWRVETIINHEQDEKNFIEFYNLSSDAHCNWHVNRVCCVPRAEAAKCDRI